VNPLTPFFPAGRSPRTIVSGIFRGIRLQLDLHGETQIWLGLYERETHTVLSRLLRHCRSAVDLGAAKGDLTIHCLRQPGMARVVAVEPLDRERIQFDANLILNGLATDPRLHLHAGFAGRGEPPLWRTLDDLAAGFPDPVFLKIDIDGPESEVLADGHGLLGGRDCRVLIETHSPEAEAGCARQLRELGYTVRIIHPAWWRAVLREHRPIRHNRWLAAWRDPLP
jgi:hypothetical protein